MLANSEVQAALVPVIEYQRLENVSLIPGVCVGSKKEVRSVVLVSKLDELAKVKSVALDESSRTSATLVKIIFREFLDSEPVWTNCSPDLDLMLQTNDAALIIGDPAMTFSREERKIWDMASLWRKHTDLGFVFAMWLVRNDAVKTLSRIDFRGARDEGVAHIDQIVASYLEKIPLTRGELFHYLTENISYEIDDSMDKGLRLYFNLALKHDLIGGVKPLQFVS